MLALILNYLWLAVAAALAGAVNALAGGGTLLTFPALVAALSGRFPAADALVIANQTSTVALAPASFSSAWAYRRELVREWRWLKFLLPSSLAGGVIGAVLVSWLDPQVFKYLVPWLILGAATLFALQPLLARWRGKGNADVAPEGGKAPGIPAWRIAAVIVFQLGVGIYGGYFGAGIGILMLSALGLMGLTDIHEMNALKTVLAGAINGVAVVVFVSQGKVVWPEALLMMAAGMVGGYLAARYGRQVNPLYIRRLVIGIGFLLAAYYFSLQFRG